MLQAFTLSILCIAQQGTACTNRSTHALGTKAI